MKIKAIIFDLDGTLTEPFLNFDRIREEMGVPLDGVCILDALAAMSDVRRRQAEAVLEHHEAAAAEQSTLNDGAAHLLDALRAQGRAIGILTRNSRRNATFVTQKHNLHIDAMVCREDGPVKPDGFGVRQLCGRFNVRPQETLVVGDFKHDLESAIDAQATAVLLKNHAKADTFEHLANYVIMRLDELPGLIERLENTHLRNTL